MGLCTTADFTDEESFRNTSLAAGRLDIKPEPGPVATNADGVQSDTAGYGFRVRAEQVRHNDGPFR